MRPPETEKPSALSDSLAGKKEGLGHTEQLALYASAKQKQEQVSAWMLHSETDLVKQAAALTGCGSWLWFHHFFRLGKHLLRGGVTCKQHLLCAPCALRRSAAYAKAYHPVIQHVLSQNPGWMPVLITKTIRNSPDLGSLYSKFTKAHSAILLARRHWLTGGGTRLNPTVYASLHGGVGSYEYKRGSGSGLWHPHSHEIALITLADWHITPITELVRHKVNGKWQDQELTVWKPLDLEAQLRDEWNTLTGGSWRCDVRMIGWDKDGIYDEEGLFGAVAEVMGYCLKMQEISPADQVAAYRILRRRRLTYTYGCLRNVEVPPEAYDTDDAIPPDEPWVELEYRWWSGQYSLNNVRQASEALFARPAAKEQTGKQARTPKSAPGKITAESVKDWLAEMSKQGGF